MTKEEVLAEAGKNPTFKTELVSSFKEDFLSGLKQEGVIIRKPEEETEFLSNYEKTVIPGKVNAQIGEKVKEVHDKYDNDLFELTGERKQGNEKTYDFLKRKISDLKKSKSTDDDKILLDKLELLEKEVKEKKDYVPKKELDDLKDKFFKDSINSKLTGSLSTKAIAVPAHITEEKAKQEYAANQRSMIKTDFLNKFTAKTDSEGNVVYYDGETILMNPTNGKPLTEDEIIGKFYPAYFAPETKGKTGLGTGAASHQKSDANEASLKTKKDVNEYLEKKYPGSNVGHAQRTADYKRILQEQGITE